MISSINTYKPVNSFFFKMLSDGYKSVLRRLEGAYEWQRVVKGTRSAMGYLLRVPYVLLGVNGRSWTLGVLSFAKFVYKLHKRSGSTFTGKYLKTCQILVMKYLAGEKVPNPRMYKIAIAMRGGLPSMIPKAHRKMIRQGDRRVCSFWLSLLGFYRIIDYKGRINLKTITRGLPDFDIIQYLNFVPIFFHWLHILIKKESTSGMNRGWEWDPKIILKSGPGSSQSKDSVTPSSSSLIVWYCVALFGNKELGPILKKFAGYWYPALLGKMNMLMIYPPEVKLPKSSKSNLTSFPLGKLGLKQEPGKVRVFAMVDWWTQMLLFPIHRFIQGILRSIPQDATFDQDKGVQSAIDKSKGGFVASYDLSAATDRLPIIIQSLLINYLLPGYGQLWSELLISRDYWLPGYRKFVRYGAGQPMGALSSWVMLALTHHFIVQLAAWRCNYRKWFTEYLILGDDIVIFDKDVAYQYCIIMEDLGLWINPLKTLLSENGSFEFAKRFVYKSEIVHIVAFPELDASMLSLDALVTMLNRFSGISKLSTIFNILGYGYKAMSRLSGKISKMSLRMKLALVWITKPLNTKWSFNSYESWLSMRTISGSYSKGFLNYKGIWDSLDNRLKELGPSGLDDSWAPTSGYADGLGISNYGSATETFGTGWKAQEVMLSFNSCLAKISFDHQLALRETSRWFYDNYPSKNIELPLLESSITFYEEWSRIQSAIPRGEEDLSKRKERRNLHLQAGRWLRMWSTLRR